MRAENELEHERRIFVSWIDIPVLSHITSYIRSENPIHEVNEIVVKISNVMDVVCCTILY